MLGSGPEGTRIEQRALLEHFLKPLSRLGLGGSGVALGITGDPGIGKTFTARALRREIRWRTIEAASAHPISLAAQLPLATGVPVWARHALERFRRGDDLETQAVADALVALLARLAPIVVHLDDYHEASREAAGLWEAVARGVRLTKGVGLIATGRSALPEPFASLRLEGCGPDGTRDLLRSQLAAELPEPAWRWIHRHAVGNPLFTIEYLRYLTRQGCLWNDGSRWRWRAPSEARIPSEVEALISYALHSAPLTRSAALVMEAIAVLGSGAAAELKMEVCGLDADGLAKAAAELERHGILDDGNFVHPLYREVALRHLPRSRHQHVARAAVGALERDDPEAAAAFLTAARLESEVAHELLQRAFVAARRHGAERRAARWLAEALPYAPAAQRRELALEAARIWRRIEPAKVPALAEAVLESDPACAEATFLLAEAMVREGQSGRAERLVEKLADADRARPEWLLRLVALRAEDNDFRAALELWRAHPDIHVLADAAVVGQMVRVLDYSGHNREALELATAGLAAGVEEPADRALLLHARCRALYNSGRLLEAEADASEAIGVLERANRRLELARALSSRATIRDTLGRYDDALVDAQASLDAFAELGLARDYAQQQCRLACLLLEFGDYDQAEALLVEGREVMARGGPSHHLALCEYNLAYLYLERGSPLAGALALKHAHAGLELARATGSPLIVAQTACMAARAEALHGSAELSRSLAREARLQVERHGSSHDEAWCTWAEGFALEALGRIDEAVSAFREAADHLASDGLELWAARLGLEAERLTGDRPAAERKLRYFVERRLVNWTEVTRRYFPGLETAQAAPRPSSDLFLAVLGPMQVSRDGRPVPYRATKGRELLARLLEARLAGRNEVPQLELQDALYPDREDSAASSALQQLVYRLRNALSPEAVVRTPAGYALGPVASDAETFLRGGDAGLWRGTYLQDLGVEHHGSAAAALYYALEGAAAALLEEDPLEAARLGRIMLEHEPYSPDRLRFLLSALSACGDRHQMTYEYEQARERYAEVGECLPARWQDWEALRQDSEHAAAN